jgi:hypothetical protein
MRVFLLGHFFSKPLCLFLHFLASPRLPSIIVHRGEFTSLSSSSGSSIFVPKEFAQIRILTLHHLVDGVRAPLVRQIVPLARNNMGMDMRYALACIHAILNRYVERRSVKDALDHARYALDSQKQILHLGGGQVVEARDNSARRHKHMAR